MKLLLLHGPGITSSRTKLQSIKKQFDASNIVVFGPENSAQEIIGSLLTPSLFPEERLIVLENPSEDFAFDSSFIIHNSSFVIWFDHELNLRNPLIKFVKENRGDILFFDASKEITVFPLLDLLANKSKEAFLEVQKLKKEGFDIFYILTMVFYLLRSLAVSPKNAPEFVKRKLVRQRINFTPERIKNLYHEILIIEFKLKMGLLEQSQAEFILVNAFKD